MKAGPAWLLAALVCALLVSAASCAPHRRRRLRADDADLSDQDPNDRPAFSVVTSCPAHMVPDATLKQLYKGNGFDVVDLTATIEMTQEATYANNFRDNDPSSWAPGETRLNYTVEVSPHGGKLPKQLIARLHTGSCFSPLDKDTVYLLSPDNATSDVEAVLNLDPATHTGSSSTVKDYLIDYDETQSFVVYDGNTMVACCDLIPPFPDFPTEWAATVEANIINQGYTYVQRETYSQARNKVRVDLHSYDDDIVMVQDYSAKRTTIIFPPNTTYPHGVCTSRDFIPSMANFVDDDAGAVYGTGQFLKFVGKTAPVFEPGHVTVRGIPCEAWYRQIKSEDTNSTFDVEFFFPVNQWLVAREDYHRMLKQITVVGTMDGEEINHQYSYINFRPYIAPAAAFDVCAISPKGSGCGCNGTAPSAQAQADAAITFNEDGTGVSVTHIPASDVAAATDDSACPSNDQFTDAQKRWYGMWAAIGFAIGAVVAWLGVVIWYRTVVGVHGGDRMGHQKMRERPFIIGGRRPSSYI